MHVGRGAVIRLLTTSPFSATTPREYLSSAHGVGCIGNNRLSELPVATAPSPQLTRGYYRTQLPWASTHAAFGHTLLSKTHPQHMETQPSLDLPHFTMKSRVCNLCRFIHIQYSYKSSGRFVRNSFVT